MSDRRSKGHRLFFVGAGLFACLSIAEWLGVLAGRLPAPGPASAAQWHAHEMLFGYTTAVLAGFILVGTAGWRIPALAALWLAGRPRWGRPAPFPRKPPRRSTSPSRRRSPSCGRRRCGAR